ncbi:MAG: hypothetical protein PGN25_21300 [Methylorubrum populi]
MLRCFFDGEGGNRTIDEEGMELAGCRALAVTAMTTRLDIGRFEVVTKAVTKNERRPVYRSELMIEAKWRIEAPVAPFVQATSVPPVRAYPTDRDCGRPALDWPMQSADEGSAECLDEPALTPAPRMAPSSGGDGHSSSNESLEPCAR